MIEVEQEADYLKGAAESCSYSILKKIDSTVGALFSALTGSAVHGSDGQTFTDDIFITLTETLDEADVPMENRSLIGDPSMRADMLKIDKFIRTDYVRTPVVATGQIGVIYDAAVKITNNLTAASTGNYGTLAHRDAIGVVIQKNPRSKAWDMGYKFLTKIICDCAWGCAEIRDTFGIAFYTRSS